jgi:integrase
MLIKIADAQTWTKKTYNNAVSALRRAFAFGYPDYLDRRDPAAALRCARIGKKRPASDRSLQRGAPGDEPNIASGSH